MLKKTRVCVNIVVGVLALLLVTFTIPDMRLNIGLLILFWVIAVVTTAASEVLEDKPGKVIIKWTASAAIGWAIVFVCAYFVIAYEDSPHLSAYFTFVSVGDTTEDPMNSYFNLALTLRNDGIPTTVKKWYLDVTPPGQPVRHAGWLLIARGVHRLARRDGVVITFSGDEDDLAHKVQETPFGVGARPWGYLQFVVRNMPFKTAGQAGTLLHLVLADDDGHQGVVDYVMSGEQEQLAPGTYAQPGTKMPLD